MQARKMSMGGRNTDPAVMLTGLAAIVEIIFTIVAILGLLGFNTYIQIPTLSLLAGVIGFTSVLLGVVWCFVDYGVIYLEVKKGHFSTIANGMLVAGVLQLVFGATVPGVLITIAWAMKQK